MSNPIHLLHVNGLDGPMLRQFGCECDRCLAPGRKANTSVSLITREDERTTHHLIFDAGLGVVDSLIACGMLDGEQARVDGVILTHWHPDHVCELNRLLVSDYANRKRRGLPDYRVPLYCRHGSVLWLQREYGHLLSEYLNPIVVEENRPPGTILPPLPINLPGMTITPISVSHFSADRAPDDHRVSYASAAYVLETANSKTVLLWDIDNQNDWLIDPQTADQETAVAFLSNADHLFVDSAFWKRKLNRRTTHASFENVLRYAARLHPRETLPVHLSGHPDGKGNTGWGWTDTQWTAAASEQWANHNLPGNIRVPTINETIQL